MQSAACARYSPRSTRLAFASVGRNAGRIGGLVVRQRDLRAAGESHRAGTADDPDADDASATDDDRDDAGEDTARLRAHAFFPAASSVRSIGSRRSATPVAA